MFGNSRSGHWSWDAKWAETNGPVCSPFSKMLKGGAQASFDQYAKNYGAPEQL